MSQNILSNEDNTMDNTTYTSTTENATYDTTTGTTTYASTAGNDSYTGTSNDTYSSNTSMGGYSSSFSSDTSSSSNSKLMKGVLIGAAIGGVVAMLDSNTRTKVKDTAMNVKDTSMNVVSEVKNNPADVKDQLMNSFKEASSILKEAISDAQNLYQRLNEDVFSKMGDAKSLSADAVMTVLNAKNDLKEVGSKVKEAGSAAMDNPVVNTATGSTSSTDSSVSSTNAAGAYATGMDSVPADTPELGSTSNTFAVSPEQQKNDNNR
jgi:gas vesicle protein